MSGLEAAVLCLHIMTTENVSKKIVDEEVLETILDMCKFQLRNYVLPFYDPTFCPNDETEEKTGTKFLKLLIS